MHTVNHTKYMHGGTSGSLHNFLTNSESYFYCSCIDSAFRFRLNRKSILRLSLW